MGLEEITLSQDIDNINDQDKEWIDDRSKPEVVFGDEQQQSFKQKRSNLRVLNWLNEMTSDPKQTKATTQDVDLESRKNFKNDKTDPSWAAQEGQLLIPVSTCNIRYAVDRDDDRCVCPWSGGRT